MKNLLRILYVSSCFPLALVGFVVGWIATSLVGGWAIWEDLKSWMNED